jgi:hypothetical protein
MREVVASGEVVKPILPGSGVDRGDALTWVKLDEDARGRWRISGDLT